MSYLTKPWLASYDPDVPENVEIPDGKTARDYLDEGFAALPDSPALFFFGRAISFSRLNDLSLRFADFLTQNGCGPGSVVALHMPNLPQYLIGLTGALRAGAAVSGCSILLTEKELAFQLSDSGARVLVTMDMFFKETVAGAAKKAPALEKILVANVGDFLPVVKRTLGRLLKKIPTGKVFPVEGKQVERFRGVLDRHSPVRPDVSIAPSDTALIQYTGGTTGLPKGVMLSHGNLAANTEQVRAWARYEQGGEVFCSGFPFFHQAGLALGLAALATSNPQCLIPDPRSTDHITSEIKSRRATILCMVPTLYHMLMENPRFRTLDFSGVRMLLSGAAPFSEEGIRAMEELAGRGKVLEVYGMTETTPLVTANPYQGAKKVGSVGLPLPNTRVAIVDVETGAREMPTGEEGELLVQGPQVMAGYHGKPDETAHAMREFAGEPWLHTGDVARMDQDGFIFIADRVKDMLNVGGFKVFSREVEETLYKHPGVEFCAIVGMKNPERPGSEIVKAVIQLGASHKDRDVRELSEDVREYCKKYMAPYKVPKIVEFIDAMPLTAVGKVDKKKLRE